MIDGLQDEINAHSEFVGAGKKVIMAALNTDGTANVETWVTSTDTIKVPKGDMLAILSPASQLNLANFMASGTDSAKVFNLFYNSHEQFKVTDSVFITMLNSLYSAEIITESEKNAILRLGERSISRSEELFDRKITLGDF